MKTWTLEIDDDALFGLECEHWLIRDDDTEGRDIVAAVPITGDDEYDDEVTYPNAKMMSAAPELLEALIDLRANVASDSPEMWGRVDAAISKATS